jgi:hypothetical protein
VARPADADLPAVDANLEQNARVGGADQQLHQLIDDRP